MKRITGIILSLSCLVQSGYSQESMQKLDRARGKIYRVNVEDQSIEFITLTAYDPQVDEGTTRHRVYWNDQTRFASVTTQSNFNDMNGTFAGQFYYLEETDLAAIQSGERFSSRNVEWKEGSNEVTGLRPDGRSLSAWFTPKGEKEALVQVDGKEVPYKLGKRSSVIRTREITVDYLEQGLFRARIFGEHQGERFVLSSIRLTPMLDPRETDDPSLPRMLLIGDSISHNYHATLEKTLKGVANLHRIEGNGGSSARGVESLDLWLGQYEEPGFHWDIIQFNHGLHDLKRGRNPDGSWKDNAATIPEYQENLETLIGMLKKTGAAIIWCNTTPVPNDSMGGSARQKDEDLIYNKAALEIVSRYPEVLITDLNKAVRDSPAFEEWRKGNNVHYHQEEELQVLADTITATVKEAIAKRKGWND
ncbi:MAG: SGNH/GDSL hydrolase family protein [Verrucomicrobiota bacterium]